MRIPFHDLFIEAGGVYTAKVPVRVGDATLLPGERFGRHAVLGGVRLASYHAHALEVTVEEEVYVIAGISAGDDVPP